MAGAFSGHLIDQYNPNSPFNSSIVSHGAMSFNPNMHGTQQAQQSFSLFNSQASFGMVNDSISEETQRKIATLQVKLNQKLGPEFISQRPGPGGGPKLTYVEGWKIINLANEVFGFNGWSSSIVNLTTDFADYNEESRKYNVGVTALIRVTLRDGVFHEDIGYGMLENSRSKGAALDKCKKEAVTDGLKRALRNFGNVMGNCLYDKSYAQEVVKIKFEPTKLNKDHLHRRPEFEDVKPVIPSHASTNNAAASSSTSRSNYSNTSMANNSSRAPNPMQQSTSRPPPMQMQNDAKGKAPAYQQQGTNAYNTSTSANRPIAGPSRPLPNAPTANTTTNLNNSRPNIPPNPAPNGMTTTKPNPPPPPQQQQQQKKKNPVLEDDDSAHFFDSDDDAFLATADLGPAFDGGGMANVAADLGRPIETDVDADMGQPINHDEGLMPGPEAYDDDDHHHGEDTRREGGREVKPMARSSSSGAKSRHELIAAALSGDAGGTSAATSASTSPSAAGGTSHGGGHGGGWSSITSGSGSGSGSASGAGSSSSSSMRPPPNPPPRATSLVQQNHQRYMAQRQQNQAQGQGQGQVQNQNVNPAINGGSSNSNNNSNSASGSSSDTGKRSNSSNTVLQNSVGGFNFPPGMNPLSSSTNTNIPNFSSTSGSAGSHSGIGIKRPADAMASSMSTSSSSSAYSFNSARPTINIPQPQGGASRGIGGMGGMGGMGGNGGMQNANGRSVLGALDITEGGDVKRRRS